MNDADRALAELARRQRQVFTRQQATAAGLGRSAFTRRVRGGLFVPVGSHTFTFAGVALGWHGRLQAGLLDLGPGAIVTAESAAVLHGLDGFWYPDEPPVVFVVERADRNRRTVGTVLSTPRIGPLDRTVIDGFPVASGTFTVVQLLGRVDCELLGNAFDSACRKGLTARRAIERRLADLGRQGRPGVADLDSVLADAGVQSGLERRFRALTKGRGYPLPTTQRVYRHKGVHVARVDFDFAPLPIIVEVGGRRGYLSSAERQRQERRRNSLQLLGKVIYFFTTEDVFDDPAYVLDTLDACLRLRSRGSSSRNSADTGYSRDELASGPRVA